MPRTKKSAAGPTYPPIPYDDDLRVEKKGSIVIPMGAPPWSKTWSSALVKKTGDRNRAPSRSSRGPIKKIAKASRKKTGRKPAASRGQARSSRKAPSRPFKIRDKRKRKREKSKSKKLEEKEWRQIIQEDQDFAEALARDNEEMEYEETGVIIPMIADKDGVLKGDYTVSVWSDAFDELFNEDKAWVEGFINGKVMWKQGKRNPVPPFRGRVLRDVLTSDSDHAVKEAFKKEEQWEK